MYLNLNAQLANYALQFDGADDEVNIFMDVLQSWTIEAWVKGDDNSWKEDELIVGSGFVSPTGNLWEDYPLHLKKGKLCAYGSEAFSNTILDDNWHHLASSCDGKTTRLYLDGIEVAMVRVAKPTAPNFIGSNNGEEAFRGQIDEVRIWEGALPAAEIQKWMNQPIRPDHPFFTNLLAYYTFDDQSDDATDLTLANRGDIKNDDYYNPEAKDPIYVTANNTLFNCSAKNMELWGSRVIQNEWPLEENQTEAQILKLQLSVQGEQNPLSLTALKLDISTSTNWSVIEKVHIYYLGNGPNTTQRLEIFGHGLEAAPYLDFNEPLSTAQQLNSGVNYFEVRFELKSSAGIGELLNARVVAFELDGEQHELLPPGSTTAREVISGAEDPDIVKALAFNIWHGGRETGYEVGEKRTIEVIEASGADIVFMIESYGAQEAIAEALGFNMYTVDEEANLSIHSRYPIIETYTSNYSSFKAIGAKVRLDNNRELIVYDVWLTYSSPDYSTEYRIANPNPDIWVEGDQKTTIPDLEGIFSQDIDLYVTDPDIPIIIAGDFNSASHLDWTEATAPLHGGVGAVDWPVHKMMIEERGYTDSYRTVHPNPLTHQGSTWAAIFNWSNQLRIDYIYHKGPNINPVASRVIETHPDAGVMWPGDHSAVLTIYDLGSKKED